MLYSSFRCLLPILRQNHLRVSKAEKSVLFYPPSLRLFYQQIYAARARQRFNVHKLVCSVSFTTGRRHYVGTDFAKRNYLP